jgi:hypothetical protein
MMIYISQKYKDNARIEGIPASMQSLHLLRLFSKVEYSESPFELFYEFVRSLLFRNLSTHVNILILLSIFKLN